MFHLITTGATYLFPSSRVLKLVTNGVNTINSTNPLTITKKITLIVLDCCALSLLRLAAHCIKTGVIIVVSMASLNPVTIGSAIHFVS